MDISFREGALYVLAGALAALLLHSPEPEPAVAISEGLIPAVFGRPAVLEINQACARELRRLPRIGQKRAIDIVCSRWEHGPLDSVDALERIQGIGPQTVEDLRPVLGSD